MESEFIAHLRKRLPGHPCLRLGPGDDAAILNLAGRSDCVVTVDMLTDGVDFRLGQADPRRIGRKSLAVNLSDLAAMAAMPIAALVALAIPRSADALLPVELFEGLIDLAESYDVAIAGGDTNTWDGPLAISVTAIGQVGPSGPLLRSGAKPGHRIFVTGALGGSILGHHFDFEPRVREALWLKERYPIEAGIDISDGLTRDLARLAQESGCGALVELDRVPISAAARELSGSSGADSTALDHALSDGEDFELILAVPPEAAAKLEGMQVLSARLTSIGQFVAEPGLWAVGQGGERRPLEPRGFEHRLGP